MTGKKKWADAAAKRGSGGFTAMRHDVLRSVNFRTLTPYSTKLLMDLVAQYRGENNGDLCAAWSLMKTQGWNAPNTLHKAKRELEKRGWIQVARQGGLNCATLYALTFFAIDDCKGKPDIKATSRPPETWRKYEQLLKADAN
jgi:hypothetical protein